MLMKTLSSGGYYVTFKFIYDFWGILEHQLKKGRNISLVWKLHQARDIT